MFTDGLPANMRRVPIAGHVLDIDRRIREGDDVWRGDPSMGLYFDPTSGMWEVWGLDIAGAPYRAAVAEFADQRLLNQLVDGDWQRGVGLFEQIEKANAKLAADQAAAADDFHEGMADKLAWAIRRDAHNLAGVSSRDMWSINWDRPRPKDMTCSSPT